MQIVYRAQDITEAHIVAGMLQSNGIDAHVGGYYLQGAIGDIGTFDFANVHVGDKDVPLARSIIGEYEGKRQTTGNSRNERKARNRSAVAFGIFLILVILLVVLMLTGSDV